MPKVNIPSALSKRNKFTGRSEVFSSRSWFEFCPDYFQHLNPNDEIEVNLQSFARALPMPVPTMGKCDLVYRSFFIPYSAVFRGWNDFKTNTVHYYSDGQVDLIPYVRSFSLKTICDFFIANSERVVDSPADFVGYDGNLYVLSTIKGRRFFKLFNALGYRLLGVTDNSTQAAGILFNALPLLCVARVYLDYYFPSQFRQSGDFLKLNQVLVNDEPGGNELQFSDINAIANVTFSTCYDDDLFVESFVEPVAYNTPFNTITLTDPSSNGTTPKFVQNSSVISGTPVMGTGSTGSGSSMRTTFTQWQVIALQRLTQYMKRNQLAGSFAYERLLARFGFTVSHDVSKYIDSYVVPVNIGDVMSTTDNFDSSTDTGASLGSYAGKALAFNSNNDGFFKFRAPTFGMFLVVCSVIPRTGYFQGINRHNLHLTPLDFYEPEFDGLNPSAINACEVFTPQTSSVGDVSPSVFKATEAKQVFGFAQLYYEYKTFRDNVIGDFIEGSKNRGLDAYFLLRKFVNSSFASGYADVKQDVNFVRASDWTQYNRMFGQDVDADTLASDIVDGFRVRSVYTISLYSNMRSLYDDIDFDQLAHNSAGDSSFDVSSAKLN